MVRALVGNAEPSGKDQSLNEMEDARADAAKRANHESNLKSLRRWREGCCKSKTRRSSQVSVDTKSATRRIVSWSVDIVGPIGF